MECPQCRSVIEEASIFCKKCGFAYTKETYDKVLLYFDLKRDLDHLSSLTRNELLNGLQQISRRLQEYEKVMSRDLQRLSPQKPVVTETRLSEPIQEAVPTGEPEKQKIASAPARKTLAPKPPAAGRDSTAFELRLGQKWLLIIGIVTMVFGVGYFLKYSFEQGWVGPAGRVALAYLWGSLFLVGGDQFRRRRYEVFGLYLIGGGIATLYFATFAAFQIYQLFGQTPSFFVMVLITVLASVLAIVYDTKWLAVLGIIGGFMTPVLLSTGQDNQLALMSYMTILNAGLLGIAFYKKWDLLNALGFIFTYLLYSAWFDRHYAETKFWPSIIFLNLFYIAYAIIPFAYNLFRKEINKTNSFLIITPNSFIAFGFSFFMIRNYVSLEWVSVVSVSYAVLFLLMATYLYRQGRQDQDAFVVLLAQSALFLVITIPLIFSKHWITIFWAAQATILLWAGIRLGRNSVITCAYLLFVVTILKFLGYDYGMIFGFDADRFFLRHSYTYLVLERAVTSLVLLGLLYLFAVLAKRSDLQVLQLKSESLGDVHVIFGIWSCLLFAILNVETSSFFYEYLSAARFAAISVLWAVCSVMLMIKGFAARSSFLRMVSLVMFFVTLTKVFTFDMANISTPYRIVSFILLGVILVITSYLYYKYKDRIFTALGSSEQKGVQ